MPLIHSKSKEAFNKNMETEMDAGKPKDQSLAIAYSMQRKKKQKKAQGGFVDKDDHSQVGQDDQVDSDYSAQIPESLSYDRARSDKDGMKKPRFAKGGKVLGENKSGELRQDPSEIINQNNNPMHKRYSAGSGASDSDNVDLEMSKSKESSMRNPQHNERDYGREEGLQDAEYKRDKPKKSPGDRSEYKFAKGGKVDSMGSGSPLERPPHGGELLYPQSDDYMDGMMEDRLNPADKFAKGGMADDQHSMPGDAIPKHIEDMIVKKIHERMARYFDGGEVSAASDGSVEEDHSIAEKIMRKKPMYADGGEVDLSRNADEDRNEEDQMSFDALRKENYSESDGLDDIEDSGHMDSGEHGDDIDADKHDMVDLIRRKLKMNRNSA